MDLFDGKWQDFKKEIINLPVKIFGPIRWTVKREAKYSVHGPVLEVGEERRRSPEPPYRRGRLTGPCG